MSLLVMVHVDDVWCNNCTQEEYTDMQTLFSDCTGTCTVDHRALAFFMVLPMYILTKIIISKHYFQNHVKNEECEFI